MDDPRHNLNEILNKPAAGRFSRMTSIWFFVCQLIGIMFRRPTTLVIPENDPADHLSGISASITILCNIPWVRINMPTNING